MAFLAACQPLERPFQPEAKATWSAAPGPRASLYIAPTENGPEDLPTDLADQLQELGIAAFTGEAVENRYSVISRVFLEKNAAFVEWEILDPQGRPSGLITSQKIGDILPGPLFEEPDHRDVILKSASEIDIMLGGSGINFDQMQTPALFIPVLPAAPGDASESLSAAMQDEIAAYGIDVKPDIWTANYVVKGQVDLTKPMGGTQVVTIRWQLERRNGEFIGKVEQRNRIRAGTLNGPWGEVAIAVAKGGARGVLKLLREAEPEFFRKKS
ncbi:hypothetical protein GCM10007924_14490 [Sneathiella chinensis]|uniref:Uncharacterized protein n=2 Tax=Sneathiella chinensis TaxID=349750 RepID=A0ABQ5U4Q3_9PROT|nr:hypothetical protein GCM10007924_14490 [Sneathiella chinensis]